jgi:two-component system, NtrC family, sensor histidine kinase GlrK
MKLGILGRWVVGYLAVFLLLAGSNTYALVQLHQLGTRTTPSLALDMRILTFQKRLVDSILSQLRYERKFMLMRDGGVYERFAREKIEFHRLLAEAYSAADTAAKRDSLKTVEGYQKRYEGIVTEQIEPLRAPKIRDDGQYRTAKDHALDGALEELKRLEDFTREGIAQKMGMVSSAARSSLSMALASSAITLFLALLTSVFMTRSITSPLKKLVTKTRDVAAGVFEGDLRIASPPEISELNCAFNLMCEKLTAVDKMKGDFFSMVSHELRTPLTTISEGTSLLLEGAGGRVTEKQESLLNILHAETSRLIRMVNSILDLSKMEAGMMAYAFEQTNIGLLVDKAVVEITPLIEAKKIVLRKEVVRDFPHLRADNERILQVLRNLIGNAAKFTPHGGRITVYVRRVHEGLEVSVEDTGPGIPDHKIANVFEKFSGSDHRSGTGLGLAIVRHIIGAHGGRVWVESTVGQGSRFAFVLPTQTGALEGQQRSSGDHGLPTRGHEGDIV